MLRPVIVSNRPRFALDRRRSTVADTYPGSRTREFKLFNLSAALECNRDESDQGLIECPMALPAAQRQRSRERPPRLLGVALQALAHHLGSQHHVSQRRFRLRPAAGL